MAVARRIASTATVGKSIAHDSAALHVSGTAIYIDDMREPEGLLHVYPGFSRAGATGRIVTLDLDAVKAAPGVVAVLLSDHIPGVNDCSPARGALDDPIIASDSIQFHGQVIFAVVAETREAARRATRLARIEIEPEPPAVTVDDAIAMNTADIGEPYAFIRRDVEAALRKSAGQLMEERILPVWVPTQALPAPARP